MSAQLYRLDTLVISTLQRGSDDLIGTAGGTIARGYALNLIAVSRLCTQLALSPLLRILLDGRRGTPL